MCESQGVGERKIGKGEPPSSSTLLSAKYCTQVRDCEREKEGGSESVLGRERKRGSLRVCERKRKRGSQRVCERERKRGISYKKNLRWWSQTYVPPYISYINLCCRLQYILGSSSLALVRYNFIRFLRRIVSFSIAIKNCLCNVPLYTLKLYQPCIININIIHIMILIIILYINRICQQRNSALCVNQYLLCNYTAIMIVA